MGIYQQNSAEDKIGFVFVADIVDGVATLSDEIMSVQWFYEREIRELHLKGQLRHPYILDVLDDSKAGKKVPLDAIKVL